MKKYTKPVCFIIEAEPQIMLQGSGTLGKGIGPASHNFSILSNERDDVYCDYEDEEDEDLW